MTQAPRGIYPMLYAFFDTRGRLDRAATRRQVEAFVNNGAHGMAVLGLGTEVGKLSEAERRELVGWVAEDLAGRLPLAVTVNAPTVDAQVEFARFARSQGAQWVILQPPPERNVGDDFLVRFFGAVADRVEIPVAVQNAPEYIGVGLTAEGIVTLARNHANFRILKGEGPALVIRRVIEQTQGQITVFNGRGGLELVDNLRAGCAGLIPATDTFDRQARIFDLFAQGREAEAEQLYRQTLPAIVFVMQSLDTLHCYGKRIAARRLGLGEVHDRAPALVPEEFGLACARRYADALGALA
ncbi:MAG TPA: dihydrodipicolinate synthase family protein [Burkholderiales bacterium]|jgi:4-hydroxy-tetrahydrodipicolinate synthase|nr:dihydrodipicolinate synthase family protein [Burkholderiales bacterium]